MMKLRTRLGGGRENGNGQTSSVNSLLAAKPSNEPDRYHEIKRQLHRQLISNLDLSVLEGLEETERRATIERVARRLLAESEFRLTRADEERLLTELL